MTPDIILAFRGKSVDFLKTDYTGMTDEQVETMNVIKQSIMELLDSGVKMEACSIALNLFKKNTKYEVIPGIKVVNNTFMSLLGYHNQGYASIPVM